MEFRDGTCPSDWFITDFIKTCEEEIDVNHGAVAVHCRAGLGRTGCLISAYLIYKYNIEPRTAIAWVRLCRPGSVIGPQQQFLEDLKPRISGLMAGKGQKDMLKKTALKFDKGVERPYRHAMVL